MTQGAEDARKALARRIADATPEAVSVRINDNRHTWVASRRCPRSGGLRVSVHAAFAEAPDGVFLRLVRFLREGRPEDRRAIQTFMDGRLPEDKAPGRARAASPVRSEGNCHDLRPIADAINRDYFGAGLKFTIGWGRDSPRRRRRSVRLGSCSVTSQRIVIHPVLDDPRVPPFFVEFVVYHELCHLAAPPVKRSGSSRQDVHNAEFKRLERAHPRYREAIAWEKANLRLLFSNRRRPDSRPAAPTPSSKPSPEADDGDGQLTLF